MNEESQVPGIRKDSEPFGNFPNDSESFGTIPNDAETFGRIPKPSERKEYCTLTVREVARMFENAGVARTERSIVNWCQPNKMGVSRLDNYFDPNERKYFISPQSVELAIQEEKAKVAKGADPSELVGSIRNDSEVRQKTTQVDSEAQSGRAQELEKEVMDLKITNPWKDYFIEQLQKDRETFAQERKGYIAELMNFNRKVGELETKLLQLQAPNWEEAKQ